MKLSISNIAWNNGYEQDEIFGVLRERRVRGVEVAPTKLWPDWVGAEASAARSARKLLSDAGFQVPALQAILYGKPELEVFAANDLVRKTLAHIEMVAAIAQGLGARVLVFGSPKNRNRGTLSDQRVRECALDFFRTAGDACAKHGTCLGLEPNPEEYECNFVTHWYEAAELVDAIAHPGVGLHLDTACIRLAGDDPADAVRSCAGKIAHFHISEPQLSHFTSPEVDHRAVGRALEETGYTGWVSIEMRRQEPAVEQVADAVDLIRDWYPVN